MNSAPTFAARLLAEFLGSLFLVTAAIAPMILFPVMLDAPPGISVMANALAVAFVLFTLIEMFGGVSGAHFNPVVTLAMWVERRIGARDALGYFGAQFCGGFAGTIVSHLMFFHRVPTLAVVSQVERSGGNYVAEFVGTFFLILAIFLLVKEGSRRIPLAVSLLVGGELMATSSTMFANPQVTVARMFTHSLAGVRPWDGAAFILMQVIAAFVAIGVFRVMRRTRPVRAS